MASTDTWDEFLAKLDNSPMGQRHKPLIAALDAIAKPNLRIAETNPQTHADKGAPL